MMKRRWSNNGGFLRIHEESSSEVTSSSNGLVLSSGLSMSPSPLDSPDYGDQGSWLCGNDAGQHYGNTLGHATAQQQSVITLAMHGCSSTLPAQTTIIPINNNNNNNNSNSSSNNNNNNSNSNNNNNNNNNSSNNSNGYVPGATNLGSLTNGGHMVGSLVSSMQQLQQNGHSLINSTTPTPGLHMQQSGINGSGGGPASVGGMSSIGLGLSALHHTNGNSNGLGSNPGNGAAVGVMGVPMGMAMQHTPRSDSANSISSG
ncbi:hypothetical protein AWZ03_010765 [Drosophila navojoa]|uniref:Ecdysone receptor n=2 Tax=Drosophila navojoa TaxID=7232 RepID=A0A484B263_DRONA|nr:hypothetical protein AWZ03_010765 [Drosophila navojoa]